MDDELKSKPRQHYLKCWPEPFDAILDGRKRFEFRLDDRGYAVGDILVLNKWNPSTNFWFYEAEKGKYPFVKVRVEYILHGGRFGVPSGYVVMSISDPVPSEFLQAYES